MTSSIEFLGAYRVEPTKALFKEAWESKFGGMGLAGKQKRAAEKFVREELTSVVLIEVLVKGQDENFDVGDFLQIETDQVAYDEVFLTLDGTDVISRFQKPDDKDLRVAFFLHYFNTHEPVQTSYGEFLVDKVQKMPKRLAALVSYTPVG